MDPSRQKHKAETKTQTDVRFTAQMVQTTTATKMFMMKTREVPNLLLTLFCVCFIFLFLPNSSSSSGLLVRKSFSTESSSSSDWQAA